VSTLPRFEYTSVADLEQALSQLSANNWSSAVLYAGGVDLLDLMKERLVEPKRLVNIKNISELKYINSDAAGNTQIGPLMTLAEIAAHAQIQHDFPALAHACGRAATPQIRNLATIGGNLCQRPRCWYFRSEDFHCTRKGGGTCFAKEGENRYHAIFTKDEPCVIVHPSAAAVALVALNAQLKIASAAGGTRTLPLEKFFILPKENVHRENVLQPSEIITGITIPSEMRFYQNAYTKQREKQSYDWPLADVAVALKMNNGVVEQSRIVLGSAAPTPWRAVEAEEYLKGKALSLENASAAGELAVKDATPLSQNSYKVPLFKVILRRTLMSLAEAKAS
jgi:xanthine dehydrogenase YagS FAD-binding subunit